MTTSPTLDLAELMLDVVPKAMQAIREEMRQGRGDHLTVPQFRILAAIKRDICLVRDLGEQLGVSEAAVSRMVDYLEQEGLVHKKTGGSDRRQRVLSLTRTGETLYRQIRSNARQRMQLGLETLSDAERQQALLGLLMVKKYLQQQKEE